MLLREAAVLSLCAAAAFGLPRAKGRIVGGSPVAKGEFPWHVSIQNLIYVGENLEWVHDCDGAIISRDFILTDGFCQKRQSDVRVVAGTINWREPGSTHNVTDRILEDVSGYGDVSLWKIEPPFEFNSDTGPVGLPAPFAESPPGTIMTVTGWEESSAGTASEVLVKLDWPIVSDAECFNWSNYTICAGGGDDNGVGLCTDPGYGAPLVFRGELRGVYDISGYCFNPALFTEVAVFREWITRVTGI